MHLGLSWLQFLLADLVLQVLHFWDEEGALLLFQTQVLLLRTTGNEDVVKVHTFSHRYCLLVSATLLATK